MAYKWWEAPKLDKGVKWLTMEHTGVYFPPAYVPHGVKMRYDGAPVDLEPAAEEVATFFAAIGKEAPQLKDEKFRKVFCKNFWKDFQKVLGPGHVVADFSKCDFDPIRAHLARASEARKSASKEEKERLKSEKADKELRVGFALVDGHIEKVGNVTIEPPGLFRGRGAHPKMGVVKRRIMPEEVTINIAPGAPVPPCPMPGHAWKRVVHDPTITWLAFWTDPVGGNHKYVYLAASSSFKGAADRDKYEKARRLKIEIPRIRKHYEKLVESTTDEEWQVGTAMWIIDRLALRVGGEKDEDEADTVGCCSLRAEHITFPSETSIHLHFLGKDSMEYNNVIELERYGEMGRLIMRNLKKMYKGKGKDDDLFDWCVAGR